MIGCLFAAAERARLRRRAVDRRSSSRAKARRHCGVLSWEETGDLARLFALPAPSREQYAKLLVDGGVCWARSTATCAVPWCEAEDDPRERDRLVPVCSSHYMHLPCLRRTLETRRDACCPLCRDPLIGELRDTLQSTPVLPDPERDDADMRAAAMFAASSVFDHVFRPMADDLALQEEDMIMLAMNGQRRGWTVAQPRWS